MSTNIRIQKETKKLLDKIGNELVRKGLLNAKDVSYDNTITYLMDNQQEQK